MPNGRALGDPHYFYKLDWLAAAAPRRHPAGSAATPTMPLALMGDWNIAPLDTDVWPDLGFREQHARLGRPSARPSPRSSRRASPTWCARWCRTAFTYWDYKQLRFPRNEGMRIDFILGSQPFADLVTAASIHRNERKGDAPSDHVPVVVDLDLQTEDDDDRPMIF